MQRCAGKKREPPPHNLESAERGREGALLETRPRASQGIRDPAAPPLRGVVPECPSQGRPRSLSHPRRRAHENPTGSHEKHTRKVSRTTRQRARVGHSLGVALIAGVSQHRQ